MGVAVGIDLGTTNTVVAAVKDGVATTLADSDGNKLIPSVVAFHPNGTVQVGQAALERRIIDPENTVYSVKRLIGRSWNSAEVQQHLTRHPFKLVEGPKGATLVSTRSETYALPEISAFVLRRAKAVAEAALGETVDAAVITVPANFDDPQRASTKMAGKLAGLEVLRILNEPTAAALAYGRSPEKTERICVYDLGGGTFDVTILDVASGVFEVLATAGDTALGGDDVDSLIVERMAEQAIKQLRVDPRGNPPAMARMRVGAETLKKALSSKPEATVDLVDIGRGGEGAPLALKFTLGRADLDRLTEPLIDRTMNVTRAATAAANLDVAAFDRVILVGGATRMPTVVRHVEGLFKRRADQRINPDEVVALGAAIQAYALRARKRKSQPTAKARSSAPAAAPANAPQPAEKPAPNLSMPPQVARAVTAPGQAAAVHTHPTRPAMRRPDPTPAEIARAEAARAEAARADAGKGRLRPEYQEIRSRRYDPRAEPESEPPDVARSPSPERSPAAAAQGAQAAAEGGKAAAEGGKAAAEGGKAAANGAKGAPELPPTRPAMTAVQPPPSRFSSVPPVLGPEEVPDLDLPEAPAPALPATPRTEPKVAAAAPVAAPARKAGVANPVELPSTELEPEELEASESLLIDVTPLSLRVETVGGYSDVLIAANSRVPCDRTRVFSTASDRQTQVFIRVAQGEKRQFGENTFLGELELSDLVPLPRGEAKIAVTFEIDADGLLAVRAKDGRTGKETAAKMHVFGAQTEEGDLEQMMKRQGEHRLV